MTRLKGISPLDIREARLRIHIGIDDYIINGKATVSTTTTMSRDHTEGNTVAYKSTTIWMKPKTPMMVPPFGNDTIESRSLV